MKYRDLVSFEALPSVVQLTDTSEADTARRRVASYVISRRMAELLTTLVVPQLQFDTPQDNRGLLVVGNYGTGKSHLMSVLSALAERPDLAELVTNSDVAAAVRPLAGRFLVLRLEIGASTRPLRDTILDELQTFAEDLGVSVDVPPMDQVTNNKLVLIDLVGRVDSQGNTLLEEDPKFRLEPEWLLVVLLALVSSGDLVLALPGNQRVDAASLGDASKKPLRELLTLRHIERPKDLPIATLLELFQLLGLAEGLVRVANRRDDGVRALQGAVERELERVVQTQQLMSRGLQLWNSALLEGAVLSDAQRALDAYKRMLEGLRPFNSAGKLKNLRLAPAEISVHTPARRLQAELEEFARLVHDLQPFTAYLTTAQAVLPPEHPFRATVQAAQNAQLAALRDPQRRTAPGVRAALLGELTRLKQEYAAAYVALHRESRLSATQDDAKKQLGEDIRLRQLRVLAHISLLPRAQLDAFQADLVRLNPCFGLSVDDLRDGPVCPRCGYRPIEEPAVEPVAGALLRLEAELASLHASWVATLRENLADPIATDSLSLWDDPAIRGSIRELRDGGTLPEPLSAQWAVAVNTILSGLERLNLRRDDLLAAIGSSPLTRDELEARLRRFLNAHLQGRDSRRVPIVVE